MLSSLRTVIRYLTHLMESRKEAAALSNKSHTHPHQNEGDKYKRHIDGSISVRGEVEAKLPPGLIQKHEAEREEDKASNKKKFVVEIVTLVVVAIYAGLNGIQTCLIRKQFIAEQRPFVWIKPQDVVFDRDWQSKQHVPPIRWDVWAFNYGKTPALNARLCVNVTITNTPSEIEKDIAEQTSTSCGGAVEGVIPQQEKIMTTLTPKHGYTPDSVDFLQNTDDAMAITGYVDYYDIAGNQYRSTFCGLRFASGATHFCKEHHNKID